MTLTFATPSRSKLTAPTPGDKRDTSRDTSGVGAMGTTKETITPPTQDSVDTDRPSSTGGGGLSHWKRMSKSDLPVQTPKGTEERGQEHKQSRKGERTTRKGANTPTATSASNIQLIPTTDGIQAQPPRSDTTHEPEGQILDSSSAITGFLELTNTVPSETYIQKETLPHLSTTLSSHSNGAKIALTESPKL